jgi:nuclear pore complex protein Nup85
MERADEVILRVPLQLRRTKTVNAGSSEEERIRAGDVIGTLKEVNATCFEYQRERVRRTICRVGQLVFSNALRVNQFIDSGSGLC